TLGIAMNWEVFDWGRKKHELAAKDASITQAGNALRDAESFVIREVNSNYRKLQQTAQMLRVAVLAQETASESLRVTTDGYKVQAVLLKDVLQSESSMQQANDQYNKRCFRFGQRNPTSTNHWVTIMNKLSFSITLLCAAVVSSSCTEARTADLQPVTPVKVQAVESFSTNNGLRYSATIRPSTQMELAFKNGGFVDSIPAGSGRLIDQGDAVAKGTVLAQLRQADFDHRLDQTSSQLSEARFALESAKAKANDNRARLERTEQDFIRAEKLYNSQSLTRSNYDAAKAEYESARAKVESASADIDSAQARVRNAEAAVADARLALQDTAI